ncbi:MAG: phosphopyruvate hydratase [Alphaproteobacteria bacterium]|nr:phosphopyruvate hydratase [Alphaproteobacteria bacterium]
MSDTIETVIGRRIWDSRGRPTVEVEIRTVAGASGRAIAPAGASTGSGEALDRRDGGAAFAGLDVRGAVSSVNGEIRDALRGYPVEDQLGVDRALVELDGTGNKARLGGNALIATSMALAHAAAASAGLPLWRHLAATAKPGPLPLPEIQILGGGAHAARRVDVQDFMVIAVGAPDYPTALDWTADVYRAAGLILADAGKLQGVADEGGYWPAFDSNEEALDCLMRAIEASGHAPGDEMAIALDIAASDFGRGGRYTLARDGREIDSDGLSEMLLGWLARYPVVSIEDPLAEDDADAFARFTAAAPPRVQVVGDDLVTTNAARIAHCASLGAGNTALIKPNQIGTLTETWEALETARAKGWGAIVSARSGETEDVTIVHLGVGWGIPQLKVGSFTRSERMAKWNEGLRLAEQVPTGDALPERSAFAWGDS